jgi:hypothetical protein
MENTSGVSDLTTLQMGNNAYRIYVEPNDFSIAHTTNAFKGFRLLGNVPEDTLVLNSSGNVGIGTNIPGTDLEVLGAAKVYDTSSGSTLLTLQYPDGSSIDNAIDIRRTGFGGDAQVGSGLAVAFTNRNTGGLWTSDYISNKVLANDTVGNIVTSGYEFAAHVNQLTGNAPTVVVAINDLSATLHVDSPSTTTNAFQIEADTVTSGNIINIDNANALTSGKALYINSDSATSTSYIAEIIQNNASSTAWALVVRNDGTRPAGYFEKRTTAGNALEIIQQTNGTSLYIDTESTTDDVIDIQANTVTTGDIISVINADALTTGSIANFVSNSPDTGTRSLVKIHNDNALATNTTPLEIIDDSSGTAIDISTTGNGLNVDSTDSVTATFRRSGTTVITMQGSSTTGQFWLQGSAGADLVLGRENTSGDFKVITGSSFLGGGTEIFRVDTSSKASANSFEVAEAYTVATLPAGTVGQIARVTDGDTGLAWGDTVVSGSPATPYLVWYNGTNWTVMGK